MGTVRDIYLCPTEVFYPYGFGEEFHSSFMTAKTLAVHFWSNSWEKDVPRWVKAAKSVRKHATALVMAAAAAVGAAAAIAIESLVL